MRCSKKLCPMQVGTVDNCTLTKEQCPYFTEDVDYQNILNQIKAAVAKEIFAEIETCMKDFEDDDDGYILKKCEFEFFMREIRDKYTEVRYE